MKKLRMGKGDAYLNIRRLFRKAASYSTKDPEVALVLARKTAEAICKFVYYTHVSDKRNSYMLEDLLQRFSKDKIIPTRILIPMRTVQQYGNFGAHDQEDEYENIDEAYASPSLKALEIIVEWFHRINEDIEGALTTSICELNVSKRTFKALQKANLTSLGELCTKTENELLHYHDIGKKMVFEIKIFLAEKSLSLGMKFDARLIKELNNIRVSSYLSL